MKGKTEDHDYTKSAVPQSGRKGDLSIFMVMLGFIGAESS